jgi:hypothetical protein
MSQRMSVMEIHQPKFYALCLRSDIFQHLPSPPLRPLNMNNGLNREPPFDTVFQINMRKMALFLTGRLPVKFGHKVYTSRSGSSKDVWPCVVLGVNLSACHFDPSLRCSDSGSGLAWLRQDVNTREWTTTLIHERHCLPDRDQGYQWTIRHWHHVGEVARIVNKKTNTIDKFKKVIKHLKESLPTNTS